MNTWLSQVEPVLHEALVQRDAYTAMHCDRVGNLAFALGEALGLASDPLNILAVAGRLHDVGKIGIPDWILHKSSALDASEWTIMRSHSERGENIVRANSNLPWRYELARIIRHHHEHYDGGGYPDALQGLEIPLSSRVLSVVDSYEAMTEPRPYHRARPHQEVIQILIDESGSKHDPQMVDLMRSFPQTWFTEKLRGVRSAPPRG